MKTKWELLFGQAKEKLIAAKALLEADEVDMEQVKGLQDEATALKDRAEALKVVAGDLDEAGIWRCRLKNQDGPYEYKPDKEEFVVTAKSEDQAVG